MDARIEERTEGPLTVVTVAGWLGAEHAEGLRERGLSVEGAISLDLSGLISADTRGVLVLRELRADGVLLEGASAFVRMLISGDDSEDEPAREC